MLGEKITRNDTAISYIMIIIIIIITILIIITIMILIEFSNNAQGSQGVSLKKSHAFLVIPVAAGFL